FKAGGAYLPLDPHAPPARLGQMIAECRAPAVLVGTTLRGTLEAAMAGSAVAPGPVVLPIDRDDPGPADPADGRPEPVGAATGPSSLAYVIFTSGSTGTPRGVMVRQGGMI